MTVLEAVELSSYGFESHRHYQDAIWTLLYSVFSDEICRVS